jgi:twitching motility protein PilT
MISFDQSLTELVQKRLITYDAAIRNATNPDDFALYFRGVTGGGTTDPKLGDGEADFGDLDLSGPGTYGPAK